MGSLENVYEVVVKQEGSVIEHWKPTTTQRYEERIWKSELGGWTKSEFFIGCMIEGFQKIPSCTVEVKVQKAVKKVTIRWGKMVLARWAPHSTWKDMWTNFGNPGMIKSTKSIREMIEQWGKSVPTECTIEVEEG